ncbi:SMI1/KNR4 family protein [Fulvivirga sp. 29W222]|uniref:SMI1/KNR4 family protein n=1 Tax=Fulvivirga marina TaxID=2494733 RepID=A0A937KFS3_9BACT|nr:SMI1/KNR4 family protein [Fulvivirga marina]MBL6448473.1 SMI1/KNR4 family protein [Fulvivirga marina]
MNKDNLSDIEVEEFLSFLLEKENVKIDKGAKDTLVKYPGLDPDKFPQNSLEEQIYLSLPEAHQQLLMYGNGMEIYEGSYRIFGLGTSLYRDMGYWNHPQVWKHAWGGYPDQFLCFGESITGNQYAYNLHDLHHNEDNAKVYELYAVTFTELMVYDNFKEFIVNGFFNGVEDDPYHNRIKQARKKFGPFDKNKQLVYTPNPLLTGGELEGLDLQLMDAQTAMTLNGDIALQLANKESLEGLKNIENYTDDQGRARIRVNWNNV